MAITMIRLKPGTYANRRLEAGEQFTVRNQRQAKLLTALGKAVVYVPPPKPKAETKPEPKERPKRQYRRRDMKAED